MTDFSDKFLKYGKQAKVPELLEVSEQLEFHKKRTEASGVICCEGLLHYGISHRIKRTAEAVVRAQLQFIAGGYVQESMIESNLLSKAKEMIG